MYWFDMIWYALGLIFWVWQDLRIDELGTEWWGFDKFSAQLSLFANIFHNLDFDDFIILINPWMLLDILITLALKTSITCKGFTAWWRPGQGRCVQIDVLLREWQFHQLSLFPWFTLLVGISLNLATRAWTLLQHVQNSKFVCFVPTECFSLSDTYCTDPKFKFYLLSPYY